LGIRIYEGGNPPQQGRPTSAASRGIFRTDSLVRESAEQFGSLRAAPFCCIDAAGTSKRVDSALFAYREGLLSNSPRTGQAIPKVALGPIPAVWTEGGGEAR
jgi:hypothetical protein